MSKVMMQCGHEANALRDDNDPACVICAPDEKAYALAVSEPDLTGRMAKCVYAPKGGTHKKCQQERPSSTKGLAFFEHRPGAPLDSYYCGCYGWD